jgi:hypothetical protein
MATWLVEWGRRFQKMADNTKQVLDELGYTIENSNSSDLLLYDRWYKGYDNSFHDYKMFSNGNSKKCRRKQLFLGKKVCEEHASLLNFDKRTVAIDDEIANDFIRELFEKRDFYFRINQFLEKTVAYGYGLILTLKDGEGKVNWVMLDPLQFYTIQRDIYGNTTGVAVPFEKFLYVETFNDGLVTVRIFRSDGNGTYDINDVSTTSVARPHPIFTIFENPLANSDNSRGYSPSVLAGAIDYMKMLDLVVTSLSDEFALGQKRIIVSESALKEKRNLFSTNPDEPNVQYFDTDDKIFQFLPDTTFGDDQPLIKEVDMKLRIGEHKLAVNMLLNLLSFQTSLGSNYFSFSDGGDNLTTATQVISNKSETYRNLKKFETNLDSRLRKFIQSTLFMSGYDKEPDISIKFDDSIIKDDSKLREVSMNEVGAKIISREFYHLNVLNLTEKESAEIMKQLENESLLIDSKESSEQNMVGGVTNKTTMKEDDEDEEGTNISNTK